MSDSTRQVLETTAKVLLWCWVLGVALQLITFAGIAGTGEMIHNMHSDIFGLSNHESDVVLAYYTSAIKLLVAVFFFIPWVALRIVLRKPKS